VRHRQQGGAQKTEQSANLGTNKRDSWSLKVWTVHNSAWNVTPSSKKNQGKLHSQIPRRDRGLPVHFWETRFNNEPNAKGQESFQGSREHAGERASGPGLKANTSNTSGDLNKKKGERINGGVQKNKVTLCWVRRGQAPTELLLKPRDRNQKNPFP